MKPMSLTSPESIAREYKGNKKAIADAARMGLVDPTAAVMAGMFIDRMRSAASEEQKPDTTVAQDVFGLPTAPQPQQTAPQPQQTAPQPQPQMPQPQGIPGAQMAAAQPRMAPGVEGLPTGDVGNYAGGGIVAFAGGMTDEQAQALGYSNAAEYYAFQDTRGNASGEVMAVPVDSGIEINRPAPEFGERSSIKELDYGRLSPKERNQRRIDEYMPNEGVRTLSNQLASHRAQRGVSDPDFYTSTPFNNLRGVTTKADVGRINTNQAENAPQTRSILPPLVAAKPEPAAPAPRVDAYNLPIPDPEANLALASRQAKNLIKVPQEESQADAIAATKRLYKDMGVDPDIYKKQGEKFEEERRTLKADKEEAKFTRLIEAGLGILGGTSPFAAVNIGQGASPAMKGFAQDIKDVKKADRELTRAQMALETTENQFKVDQSKSVQGRMEKNQDRVDKAQSTLAATTATLGASINTLTGSQYDARLRDITSRAVANTQLEGTKFSSTKQLEGSLAHAGAIRHSADKDTRGVERIMKERGVDYTTALGLFYDQRQRDFDRFNSISNRVNAVNKDFNSGVYMQGKQNDLRKLDPVKDKDKIKALNDEILKARREFQRQNNITDADLLYLSQEPSRLTTRPSEGNPSNLTAPPPAAVADLKANPTPQAREQFDAIFGPGAAARELGK